MKRGSGVSIVVAALMLGLSGLVQAQTISTAGPAVLDDTPPQKCGDPFCPGTCCPKRPLRDAVKGHELRAVWAARE